jgi:hypothetical protein
MGYIGYVYVESKAFEFRSDVRGGVRFEERSKGLTRSVIMAWPPIHWLLVAWDFLAPVEKAKEKWRTFRFGSIVYVLLRRTNRYGNFLEISEYGRRVGGASSSFQRVKMERVGQTGVSSYLS